MTSPPTGYGFDGSRLEDTNLGFVLIGRSYPATVPLTAKAGARFSSKFPWVGWAA